MCRLRFLRQPHKYVHISSLYPGVLSRLLTRLLFADLPLIWCLTRSAYSEYETADISRHSSPISPGPTPSWLVNVFMVFINQPKITGVLGDEGEQP